MLAWLSPDSQISNSSMSSTVYGGILSWKCFWNLIVLSKIFLSEMGKSILSCIIYLCGYLVWVRIYAWNKSRYKTQKSLKVVYSNGLLIKVLILKCGELIQNISSSFILFQKKHQGKDTKNGKICGKRIRWIPIR